MRVGIIAPIKYQNLNPSDLFVCYASLLTNRAYRDFFTGREGTIILDYSASLPREHDLDRMIWGIKLIRPSLVVLPSVDYSYARTNYLVEVFLYGRKFKQELIGVLQGVDLESLNKCYSLLRDNCSIIGLPSPLETIARREEIIRDLGVKEKVIYLEVHSNPYEEVPPSTSLGICTSYPVRLAADLRRLSEFSPTPPPLNFYKENLVVELIEKNIREYVEEINHVGR